MAGAERVEIFNVDINKFYQAVVDYESYPDFVQGVEDIEVLEKTENSAKVKFKINMIKNFEYVINLTQKAPNEVSWTFDSGDLFKKNDGGWKLRDLGDGKIEVTYFVDADFKVFAPKMIVNKLVSTDLPRTMKAYYERAKNL